MFVIHTNNKYNTINDLWLTSKQNHIIIFRLLLLYLPIHLITSLLTLTRTQILKDLSNKQCNYSTQ